MEIPKGKSKEEIREREYIIKCFYQKWKSENRSLRKFNLDLSVALVVLIVFILVYIYIYQNF